MRFQWHKNFNVFMFPVYKARKVRTYISFLQLQHLFEYPITD